jgi:hypothetical protein
MAPPGVADNSSLQEDDDRKVFVSRVPRNFTDEMFYNALYEVFGDGIESASVKFDEELKQGQGYGFIVFANVILKEKALKAETVKAKGCKMYLRRIQRAGREGRGRDTGGVCFLWQQGTCTHGDTCKFKHTGPGSCRVKETRTEPKVQKCFKFRKGKCNLGDECPFRHDEKAPGTTPEIMTRSDEEKPCFNWKKKGKCRKGDACPYMHVTELDKKKKGKEGKKRKSDGDSTKKTPVQPVDDGLHVRVFGLTYDSTKEKVREFFSPCGEIEEVEFPVFEDSQRSKGFCGLKFVEKAGATAAVEKDGVELDGRWLRIQRGKMFATWDKHNAVGKVESKTVFVGNLDWKSTEDELKAHFQKRFGPVVEVKLSRNYKKEKGDKRVNKGYCHITFESIFSAAKAVKQDGTTILGRRARIDFAAEEALEDCDDRTQKRVRSE